MPTPRTVTETLSACPHRQFHTLLGLLHSWAALSNSYPEHMWPCMEAVFILFMMAFGMTQPGRKPATYRMRGEHANRLTNLMWYIVYECLIFFQFLTWLLSPTQFDSSAGLRSDSVHRPTQGKVAVLLPNRPKFARGKSRRL